MEEGTAVGNEQEPDASRGIAASEPGPPTAPSPEGFHFLREARPNGSTTLQSLVGRPKAVKKHAAYLGQSGGRPSNADATLGRHAALPWDGTRLLMEQRVQDLMAECGLKRSLQTSIVDLGSHINTNMLRYKRNQSNLENLPMDGGWQYSLGSCLGNWVEERRDPAYASGFHARELGLSPLHQTEQQHRFKPLTEAYIAKITSTHPIAKFPKPSGNKAANAGDGRYVYYSASFGEQDRLDHTAPSKRGGYWLGTAPFKAHETIAMSSARQEQLEFQKRCAVFDSKAKILDNIKPLDMTDRRVQSTMQHLEQSQRHTANWGTVYSGDFKDRSRCSLTLPSNAARTQLPDILVKPCSS